MATTTGNKTNGNDALNNSITIDIKESKSVNEVNKTKAAASIDSEMNKPKSVSFASEMKKSKLSQKDGGAADEKTLHVFYRHRKWNHCCVVYRFDVKECTVQYGFSVYSHARDDQGKPLVNKKGLPLEPWNRDRKGEIRSLAIWRLKKEPLELALPKQECDLLYRQRFNETRFRLLRACKKQPVSANTAQVKDVSQHARRTALGSVLFWVEERIESDRYRRTKAYPDVPQWVKTRMSAGVEQPLKTPNKASVKASKIFNLVSNTRAILV